MLRTFGTCLLPFGRGKIIRKRKMEGQEKTTFN